MLRPGSSSAALGAFVSRRQVQVSGVASTLPAASSARTSNVCDPSVVGETACGLVQAVTAPPSSRHWKWSPPEDGEASDAVNVKLGDATLDGSPGFVAIAVSGRTVSTVTFEIEVERLPELSVATAFTARGPSAGTGHEASKGALESVPSDVSVPPEQSVAESAATARRS